MSKVRVDFPEGVGKPGKRSKPFSFSCDEKELVDKIYQRAGKYIDVAYFDVKIENADIALEYGFYGKGTVDYDGL